VAPADVCGFGLACGLDEGWSLACGGLGRVRDMLAVNTQTGQQVVLVGDGAATYDPRSGAWRVQSGRELSGLRGLFVTDPADGWAVGERGRIARLRAADGCWLPEGPELHLNGRIVLEAMMTDDSGREGWAVGRHGAGGQLLSLTQEDGAPAWRDVSDRLAGLPPLTDIHLLRRQPDGTHQAWLVSPDAGQVLEAALGGAAVARLDERMAVTNRDGSAARPREVAMRAGIPDEGWLFGPSGPESDAALVGWRYGGDGRWLLAHRQEGRPLVDLYFDSLVSPGKWWLGLAPNERRSSLLQVTDRADGQGAWSDADGRAPPVSSDARGGSRAVASIVNGDALYAWGDDVWRHVHATDTWVRLRQRRELVAVAQRHGGTGAWLLARAQSAGPDTGGHAQLLLADRGILRPATVASSAHEPAGALPPLRALTSAASGTWAVGDGGALAGPSGTAAASPWRLLVPPAAGPDLVAVAAADDGDVWAVGSDGAADGVLVRLDQTRGSWTTMASVPSRPLLAVAALDGGLAWAVGHGVACACDRASCACEQRLPFAAGAAPEPLVLRAVAAVRTASGPAVWAAGGYYVVRMDPAGWAATRRARRLDGVPAGASVVGLVAGGEDDLWALATCRPYPEEGRGVSLVRRFAGAWDDDRHVAPSREALAIGLPLADMALAGTPGRRQVWLAGDWSTLLSHTYAPGAAPAPAPELAPDLRCVASEAPASP